MRLVHRPAPLPSFLTFLGHLARSAAVSFGLIGGSLAVGIVGYQFFAGLSLVDAILNASMILTGMGPISPMTTDGAKLFASAYALFSGVAFLTAVSVLLAPAAHRFLHRFHLDVYDEAPTAEATRPAASPPGENASSSAS